ncbi:hypothetical protein L6232_23990, partial [Shewanella sp. C31]|nr:hypothetical protein [Shewanella electrica]
SDLQGISSSSDEEKQKANEPSGTDITIEDESPFSHEPNYDVPRAYKAEIESEEVPHAELADASRTSDSIDNRRRQRRSIEPSFSRDRLSQ